MLRFLSACIDGSWIAPLTHAVIVIMGLTFQPFHLRIWMSGLYSMTFFIDVAVENFL